jgi:hopanoid biosynthesis associated protein HpnK
MVAGTAAADAVERARALPQLRTGLHIVLVEGTPALPPDRIPDLVDQTGRFRTDMARLGFDMLFRPAVRAQLMAEIEAQFAAYAATGLALDHVNAHKHFHLHPTIAGAIVSTARRYGVKAIRVPLEPASVLARVEPGTRAPAMVTLPWAKLLAWRLRRAGLRWPDAVFGLAWTGAMTPARVEGLLRHLPPGCSEIYLHPATASGFAGHAPGYRYVDELAALVSPATIAAVRDGDIGMGGYSDFF